MTLTCYNQTQVYMTNDLYQCRIQHVSQAQIECFCTMFCDNNDLSLLLVYNKDENFFIVPLQIPPPLLPHPEDG